MKKRLLTCLIGLVGLTATGYTVYGYTASVFSSAPTDVIRQGVPCSTDGSAKAESVQVISTHQWSKGVVVLYSALCPASGKRQNSLQRVFGHKVVKQDGMKWQVSGSDSYGTEALPKPSEKQPSEKLVNYGISRSTKQGGDRYAILYGQVISPKVSAVEVTFDNGQILRDESSNGVFALVSPGATGVCELRVFGTDNQILQQEDLAIPKQFARENQTHQCLPVTHQL